MGMRPSASSLRESSWIGGYVRLASQLVAMILGKLWWAFVLMTLWNWFIPATFHVSRLGVAAAFGVMLVIGVITYPFMYGKKDDVDEDEPWLLRLGNLVGSQLLTGCLWLLAGLIVVSIFT